MPLLHIALQDGFEDDTVEVRVDGREVYRKEGVTTLTQISRADAFEVPVSGQVRVDVSLLGRHVSTSVAVPEGPGTTYLGISQQEGTLVHRLSAEPFGYA